MKVDLFLFAFATNDHVIVCCERPIKENSSIAEALGLTKWKPIVSLFA